MQLPSADSAGFHAEMAALWRGIQRNSVPAAMPAFFPEDAYAQVKTLGDPRGDWVIRLLLDYRLDIAAVHALVGADVDRAQLVEVQVPGSYAHWVDPGACYNAIGYYEVPNSRLVYRESRRAALGRNRVNDLLAGGLVRHPPRRHLPGREHRRT